MGCVLDRVFIVSCLMKRPFGVAIILSWGESLEPYMATLYHKWVPALIHFWHHYYPSVLWYLNSEDFALC